MHDYQDLATASQRVRPVLFSLPGPDRERNLHARLADAGIWHPAATVARDSLPAGASVADAAWWPTRRRGGRQRLTGLATLMTDDGGAP